MCLRGLGVYADEAAVGVCAGLVGRAFKVCGRRDAARVADGPGDKVGVNAGSANRSDASVVERERATLHGRQR